VILAEVVPEAREARPIAAPECVRELRRQRRDAAQVVPDGVNFERAVIARAGVGDELEIRSSIWVGIHRSGGI
jgi:hypothetical protein